MRKESEALIERFGIAGYRIESMVSIDVEPGTIDPSSEASSTLEDYKAFRQRVFNGSEHITTVIEELATIQYMVTPYVIMPDGRMRVLHNLGFPVDE